MSSLCEMFLLWVGVTSRSSLAVLLVEFRVEDARLLLVPEPLKLVAVEPQPDEPREYLPPADAARLLNMPAATLAKWRSVGGGPTYVKVGGRILYRREVLNAFVSDRSFPHTSAYDGPPRRTRGRNRNKSC
jgi:hypothetical protein